jgi:hypothetical protein
MSRPTKPRPTVFGFDDTVLVDRLINEIAPRVRRRWHLAWSADEYNGVRLIAWRAVNTAAKRVGAVPTERYLRIVISRAIDDAARSVLAVTQLLVGGAR